jgi:hypothetical protein
LALVEGRVGLIVITGAAGFIVTHCHFNCCCAY